MGIGFHIRTTRQSRITLFLVGIGFILFGLFFMSDDQRIENNYEKVEAIITIHTTRNNGRVACVTYTYDDVTYSEIKINKFNIFTMKNGEPYPVYISKARPDQPFTVDYAIDKMFIGVGFLCIGLGIFVVVRYIKHKSGPLISI